MKKVLLLVLCAAMFLSACGGDTTPAVGTVVGQVLALDTALPLANVQVRIGNSSSATASDGSFTLSNVPVAARAIVRFEATGYMLAFKNVEVTQNQTSDTQVVLSKTASSTTFAANANAVIIVPSSSAQVALAANSLVDTKGTVASGNLTAQVTPIDPASNPQSMPGDYTAQNGEPIESFGALNIELKDSSGNKLNLASGKTATIRIPVASRETKLPPTIPLFYFDEKTGVWVEEGSAALLGTPTDRYYEGTVSHFSFWNADQIYNTVYVDGCLVDTANLPVTNGFSISSQGVNYSGANTKTSIVNTNNFRVAVKKNAVATLIATKGASRESNAVQVTASGVDTTLTTCLVLGDVVTNIKPVILAGPRSKTVLVGSPAGFSVTVSSSSPASYQWYRNAVVIPNETANAYTLNPTVQADNGAVFTVVVSNLGGSVTSFAATLTVLATPGAIPTITAQPLSSSRFVGQNATFGVSINSPTAISFQWYRNGVLIAGATNSVYGISAVNAADNGAQFAVVITNLAGSVTSAAATLTVTAAPDPAITQQPSSQSTLAGLPVTFNVAASGTNPLSYQWYRNSALITGAINSSYTIAAPTLQDNFAVFYVMVSNSAGSITSTNATLNVM